MELVVDTNILISALLKRGITRKIILLSPFDMYTVPFVKAEIEKHGEDLRERCNLDETTFHYVINVLLDNIKCVEQEHIEPYKDKALETMRNIDVDDAPFIALGMALDCPIWSNDNDLKEQSLVKVYTTKEILKFLDTDKIEKA